MFVYFCPPSRQKSSRVAVCKLNVRLFVRLHLRSAERYPLSGTHVRLRSLDLLPLQGFRQRHQGTETPARFIEPAEICGRGRSLSDHLHVCLSQIAIPVVSVTNVKKTKTAILVPNALVIATANDRVRAEARRRR